MSFFNRFFKRNKANKHKDQLKIEPEPMSADRTKNQEEINAFLNKLSADWHPIKEQANKYFDNYSRLREDGAVQIFRRPWIAPLNFGLVIFPPVYEKWLNEFYMQTGIEIPSLYKHILLNVNGCFVYDFSLYGLPKSVYTEGLLDRSYLQQYDLGSANMYWKHEYKIDNSWFYIGGRHYSFEENLGYFLNGNEIFSVRKNGTVLNIWTDFNDFLIEEIRIVEQNMIRERDEK